MTRQSSPWPVVVALGLATAELGILFGLVPLAVGGVLACGGSLAGIAREAGYADSVWRPLRLIGVAVGAASALVWASRSAGLASDALLAAAATDGIAIRAAVVLAAGVMLVAAGYVGPTVERWR